MAFQKSKYFRSQDTENKSRILPFGNPNTAGHRNFAKFQERPACWSWLLRKISVLAVMGPDGCATCLQMATPASVVRGGRQNTLPLGRCGACLPRRASVRRKGLETINDVGDVPGLAQTRKRSLGLRHEVLRLNQKRGQCLGSPDYTALHHGRRIPEALNRTRSCAHHSVLYGAGSNLCEFAHQVAGLALVEDALFLFSILSRPYVGRSDHTQRDRPPED